MGALFNLHEWDAQARSLPGKLLELVKKGGLLPGPFVEDRVGEGEKPAARAQSANQTAGDESAAGLHLCGNVVAKFFHVDAWPVQLADFLFQGHTAQQIFDAPVHV
jgi:hypothetical protein